MAFPGDCIPRLRPGDVANESRGGHAPSRQARSGDPGGPFGPGRARCVEEAAVRRGARAATAVPLPRDAAAAAVMLGIGFSPITALALSLMGICTLPFATLVLVLPALALGIGLGFSRRSDGRLMARGFLMGIAAVACYDAVRIPFILAGWLDDFIPRIGAMLAGEGSPHTVVGYLWRYLGNGGGMGMAFVCALRLLKYPPDSSPCGWDRPRATKGFGVGFGVFVWACLIGTLVLAPRGEEIMFVITPATLLLTLIGHLVFGYTLGALQAPFADRRRDLSGPESPPRRNRPLKRPARRGPVGSGRIECRAHDPPPPAA